MAPIAIGFGGALILLSGVVLALADKFSGTILIPAGFGIALIVLGLLARDERFRMHAMHAAALLGLIGFAVPLVRVLSKLIMENDLAFGVPVAGQLAMSLLCLVFVGLCVKSFIDARKARKVKEAEGPPAAPPSA